MEAEVRALLNAASLDTVPPWFCVLSGQAGFDIRLPPDLDLAEFEKLVKQWTSVSAAKPEWNLRALHLRGLRL